MSRANFADLLKAQRNKGHNKNDEKPKLEIVQPTPPTLDTPPTSATVRTLPTPDTSATPTTSKIPISPEKDFTKVANSIVREALAGGMFIGKSKQIYDYLYSLTRGAIKPVRTVRITKSKLMRGSDIGSERTLLKNLAHLKSIGLIKITEYEGQHLGNEYETFLPEEMSPHPPHPLHSQQAQHAQLKRGTLPSVESEVSGVGLLVENKELNGAVRLSFKDTKYTDDEPFSIMNKVFSGMGKGTEKDWQGLAELLKMEFEIAAARTKSVTNAPAFLTEHLRRRLMPAKREVLKSKPSKTSKVGKHQPSEPTQEYKAEPLTKQGRESTLKTFSGYVEKGQKDFLMGLEDTYTKEDWEWLMKELKIE